MDVGLGGIPDRAPWPGMNGGPVASSEGSMASSSFFSLCFGLFIYLFLIRGV